MREQKKRRKSMRKTLKKFTAMGMVVTMAVSLFTGCDFTKTTATQDKIDVKVAGVSADGTTYTYGMKKFKELLEEKSDDFNVILYMGDMSSDEAEIFELAQGGDVQIAWVGTGSISSFVPELQILDLPYLFGDTEDVEAFIDSETGDEFLETVSDAVSGITAIAYHQDGWRALTNSTKPITTLEDAKGLKVRCMQSDMFIQTYKALGMEPTALAYSDLYTGLETGVVDAQDNGLMYAVPDGYAEIQKYLTYDYLSWTAGLVATNTEFLDSLSDENRELFIECAEEAGAYQRETTWNEELETAKEMEEDGEMEVCYELEDQDKWEKAVQSVYDDFYKEHPDWEETVEKIKASFQS